jgi:hypothetical protein
LADVQGLDDLMRRLHALGETQPVLRALQLAAIQEAQKLVPRRTGFLQRNIRPGPIRATSAIIEARTPYAAAVEFGTKPHIIRPRNGKALAWGGPRRLTGSLRSGGKPTHFAKVVHHPGTKAQPYLLPGARHAVERVRDVLVKRWNDAA